MLNSYFNLTITRARQTCLWCAVVLIVLISWNLGVAEAQQVRFEQQAGFTTSNRDAANLQADLQATLDRVGPSPLEPIRVEQIRVAPSVRCPRRCNRFSANAQPLRWPLLQGMLL